MRAHSSPPQPIVTFPASLLHLRSGNSIQWLNNGIVSWEDTQLNILFLFTPNIMKLCTAERSCTDEIWAKRLAD